MRRRPWTPGALALGLWTTTTGCPADVAIDEPTSTGGETTGGTGQLTGGEGGTTPTSGPVPGSTGDSSTGDSSTGAATANLSGTSTGDAPDTSTTDTSTSTDGTTGDASSTGADTTTGDASSTSADTTTGDTTTGTTSTSTSDTTSDTTSDSTSTGGAESTTDADTTTGEQEPLESIALCCEPGCTATLLQSARSFSQMIHNGARIVTRDGDRMVLWDAATATVLQRVDQVDSVALVDDTLAYQRAGQIHVLDAGDLTELGVCPAATTFGLAADGGYLWTAGPAGIEVIDPDCALRWSVGGSLAAARVLATPDRLHVFAPGIDPQGVAHFDAVDGTLEIDAFVGTFVSWFEDVPRYWTAQGKAYHLYDIDGSELELADGDPKYGWGARLVIGNVIRDIFTDESISIYGFYWIRSGPALLRIETVNNVTTAMAIVRLDQDPLVATPISPPCCLEANASGFSYAASTGGWVMSDSNGIAVDDLGRTLTFGRIHGMAGSNAGGRVAVDVNHASVRLFEVDDESCSVAVYPPFVREGAKLFMPNDGSRLESIESWQGKNKPYPVNGLRRYALPGFEKLSEGQFPQFTSIELEYSDDMKAWAGTFESNGFTDYTAEFPGDADTVTGGSTVLPRFSPDGSTLVISDVSSHSAAHPEWSFGFGYIRKPKQLLAVFEGVPRGFIDAEHILVGRYVNNDVFVKMEIVGLDGLVTDATTLPEIREMARTGTGEILAVTYPGATSVIFDPFTSKALWKPPAGTRATAMAGPDHVIYSDQSRIVVERWR